jgi:hypothetical protein
VSVVTSGLFGTMSGSSVSNVITTGAMTIPLMVKVGYRPAVAGGIESAASVGGALMPPVMGAAAFVMAEITNIPYGDIIVAAAIGAVLYYFAILAAVHFEAKRAGMEPMPLKDIPAWREVLADAHLVIPIGLLVWLMSETLVGQLRGLLVNHRDDWRVAAAGAHAHGLARHPRQLLPRRPDHGAAGGVDRGCRRGGLGADRDRHGRGLRRHHQGDGGRVARPAAGAGGADGAGAGARDTDHAVLHHRRRDRRADHPGTGAATGRGPAPGAHVHLLLRGDRGCDAARGGRAFAAAAIAKAGPTITSVHATRFGIAGFTVGFAFIYDPGIMLRGGIVAIATATAIQVAALTLITSAYAGFLLRPMGVPLRIVLGVAGLFAAFGHIAPDALRLAVGVAALAGTAIVQGMLVRARRAA